MDRSIISSQAKTFHHWRNLTQHVVELRSLLEEVEATRETTTLLHSFAFWLDRTKRNAQEHHVSIRRDDRVQAEAWSSWRRSLYVFCWPLCQMVPCKLDMMADRWQCRPLQADCLNWKATSRGGGSFRSDSGHSKLEFPRSRRVFYRWNYSTPARFLS